ncbi:Lipase_GDSL domain-containing protein [Cephalotus follicularis]|uniref:Lipase_GDSL domain-containing protein n=1 Tax=Cephalotus follicularis TaxID=3775 RepID=A0A1Q3C932_CEPFO|nr:Lipase_GDSL domain-containing protein [Cephalotus follicularis]
MSKSSLVFVVFATLVIIPTISLGKHDGPKLTSENNVALFVFGDSLFDVGNNNFINTSIESKANFPPYGETFFRYPTGRFCDGRIIPDYAVTKISIMELTSRVPEELFFLKIIQKRFGGVDYVAYAENYKNTTESEQLEFVSRVIGNFSNLIEVIYQIGGRKFAFQNVGPLGCTPGTKQAFNLTGYDCYEMLQTFATLHNNALSTMITELERKLHGFTYLIYDFFTTLNDRIQDPTKYGFKESNIACCGKGTNRASGCGRTTTYELCSDPNEYVYFDGGHTTEHCNSQLENSNYSLSLKMANMGYFSPSLLASFLLLGMMLSFANGQPLVPAMFVFGDSVFDVGNNNHLYTIVKANFPPYGRDFVNHKPTGRFCNGKLATDFTAENIGFTSYPPAYLSKKARGKKLLIGANFASGASGYYDATAKLYDAISLSQQLDYFKEYKTKLVEIAGKSNASSIISGALYLVSAGSSDFVQNYYIDPLLYEAYSPLQFSDILIKSYSNFIQNLYKLGARKIGVTSLPPIGCLPATITIFGEHSNGCLDKLNNDAVSFNNKLNATSQSLLNKLSGLNLLVFDIYQPIYSLVKNPSDNGFVEARRACCGTGLLETSILCNAESVGTCANASEYVFWDGFHPSEAANKILSDDLLTTGISLIF